MTALSIIALIATYAVATAHAGCAVELFFGDAELEDATKYDNALTGTTGIWTKLGNSTFEDTFGDKLPDWKKADGDLCLKALSRTAYHFSACEGSTKGVKLASKAIDGFEACWLSQSVQVTGLLKDNMDRIVEEFPINANPDCPACKEVFDGNLAGKYNHKSYWGKELYGCDHVTSNTDGCAYEKEGDTNTVYCFETDENLGLWFSKDECPA